MEKHRENGCEDHRSLDSTVNECVQKSLQSISRKPNESEPASRGEFCLCFNYNCLPQSRVHMTARIKSAILSTYRGTGGVIAYVLLFFAVYTTSFSLNPSIALLPRCRRIIFPDASTQTHNKTNPNVSMTTAEQHSLPSGYKSAFQCQNGEALSVIIYYCVGFVLGELVETLRLPGLLGMLIGGVVLRNIGSSLIAENILHKLPNGSYPFPLNSSITFSGLQPGSVVDTRFELQDPQTTVAALLTVNSPLASVLRQIAFAVILTQAGLGIDPGTLKKVCRTVLPLAFGPCFVEVIAVIIASKFIIGWPWAWAAILGFVCAAVSPAVVVPNMLRLENAGWGVAKGIPTLIVATSSLENVIAITGFGVALSIALSTNSNLVATIIWGPAQALIGTAFGIVAGLLVCLFPLPKMAHSHLIRGLLLVLIAVSGLVGASALHMPGAGALDCLVFAFTTAVGWRAGFPWKLVQFTEEGTPLFDNGVTSSEEQKKKQSFDGSVTDGNGTSNLQVTTELVQRTEQRSSVPRTNRGREQSNPTTDPSRQSAKKHPVSNIPKSAPASYSTLKLPCTLSLHKASLVGSPIASTSSQARKSVGNGTTSVSLNSNPIPRLDRKGLKRFSLPEPTAHYELEYFAVFRSSESGMNSTLAPLVSPCDSRSRPRFYSQTFRRQSSGKPGSVASKFLAVKKERGQEKNPLNSDDLEFKDTIFLEDDPDSDRCDLSAVVASVESLPPTAQERGAACVQSMRLALAAIWWFAQPILFTLIGSEVDFTRIRDASTGFGVLCFLIALFFRFWATVVAVLPSNLNMHERLFVACAWLPKATVQAAIGPVALDTARQMHASAEVIGWAEIVVTVAVVAVIVTAPLGAVLISLTAPRLLHKDSSLP
ncbi:unnamed protein product [Calicophoron daubneyi]|uniref:Uncharacterized protein n=1 Tax=Calicophoron daubneyi TaxID=300641 RepID=A0AAV2TXR1_CALDB